MAFEEANDAVVSERSIFSEIRIIKVFSLFRGIHIYLYLGFKYTRWQKK